MLPHHTLPLPHTPPSHTPLPTLPSPHSPTPHSPTSYPHHTLPYPTLPSPHSPTLLSGMKDDCRDDWVGIESSYQDRGRRQYLARTMCMLAALLTNSSHRLHFLQSPPYWQVANAELHTHIQFYNKPFTIHISKNHILRLNQLWIENTSKIISVLNCAYVYFLLLLNNIVWQLFA